MQCPRIVCNDLDEAVSREWVCVNGRGGYACSTVIGLNTRRAHGLFAIRTSPSDETRILLSKIEETFRTDGREFELSCNDYPGVTHPDGYRHLIRFDSRPVPCWLYRSGKCLIEKSLIFPQGKNTLVVRYRLRRGAKEILSLRPLIAGRPADQLLSPSQVSPQVEVGSDGMLLWALSEDEGTVRMSCLSAEAGGTNPDARHPAVQAFPEGEWYRNVQYSRDRDEGLDFQEDLYEPVEYRFELSPYRDVFFVVEFAEDGILGERVPLDEVESLFAETYSGSIQEKRQDNIHPLQRTLGRAASHYLAEIEGKRHVISGYPAGDADWRSMAAALAALIVGRQEEVPLALLKSWAERLEDDLDNVGEVIAARSPADLAESALHFVAGLQSYQSILKSDPSAIDPLLKTAARIVTSFSDGIPSSAMSIPRVAFNAAKRRFIRMEPDGLLAVTAEDGRLPRRVELNALWLNALRFVASCNLSAFGVDPFELRMRCSVVKTNFGQQFWNEERNYLFDSIDKESSDGRITPRALIALSLPECPVPADKVRAALKTAKRCLSASHGLLSSSRSDAADSEAAIPAGESVDKVQGKRLAEPQWVGCFAGSLSRAADQQESMGEGLTRFVDNLVLHLPRSMLGHISSHFDSREPCLPRGNPADAAALFAAIRLLQIAIPDAVDQTSRA